MSSSKRSRRIDLSTSRLPALAVAAALAATATVAPIPSVGAGLPPRGGPDVGCPRCIVVDETGAVLWARAPDDRYPNASTTKMVTALVVRERAAPSESVTVSPGAAAVGGGGLDLSAGDVYSVDGLLHALLLDSSNEAAVALAEHVAGSEGAFVTLMNRTLRRIGADRTHFVNAHGLDVPDHYASARDLARIGAVVLEDRYLAGIVATAETAIDGPRGALVVENRNLLLESYPGAVGIKTGRTLGAGNVLVAAARREGHTLIAVAMGTADAFADAAALLDHGFALLARTGSLVAAGDTVGALVFDGAGTTRVVAAGSLEGIVPPDRDDIDLVMIPSHAVTLPLELGETVGLVRVVTPRGPVGTVDAVAADDVGARTTPWPARILSGLLSAVGWAGP